jgi:hypothetical protein
VLLKLFSFLSFLEEQRMQARLINSTITNAYATIVALPTNSGTIPANFPRNYNEFNNAQTRTISQLLDAYDLPLNGSPEERKDRLIAYLGLFSYTTAR